MPNRLAEETSPYLRQHAGNPVDWWPWSDEALATARRENKPILLSIGYAACHWCHVMAHESFEDAQTARAMNALYVNIKVDREERPDIDKVYQLAHQALARRGGGWPLTMFLTPGDLLPFFAGTYFPKTPRHNMPAFMQVLEGVRRWFDQKPDEVRAQNGALARFLADHGRSDAHVDVLDGTPLHTAIEHIAEGFDDVNGGRRGGPKFPHASEIEWLLACGRRDAAAGAAQAGAMARLTLSCMASRGLRDHLGGGFFRYCVDAEWDIPHFEKMLYDNAQLLPLYAAASVRFGEPAFAEAAIDCADWLTREMSAPGGGFWSSLDADSEGEEGRYYVWQRDEIRALLDEGEFALVERRFGLDRPPNFEQHAWHLREVETLAEAAKTLDLPEAAARERWQHARAKLLAARVHRIRPGLDDKILTAWNALTIAGAARALHALPELHTLREHAEHALGFLHDRLWRDGRLYASHARGESKFPAYLDDHAFLLDAVLAMLQLRWRTQDLDWAIALADTLLERFEDRQGGGFYFTAHDAEALPQRPKPFMDESLPAGNGVAARALLTLGHLLGETRYLDAAERTLRAAWPTLVEYPHACCTLLLALDEFLDPRPHVVIRHRGDDVGLWRETLSAANQADIAAYFIPAAAEGLRGVLAAQITTAPVTALLCRGVVCSAPITDPAALQAALSFPAPGGLSSGAR
ncbi:MAG TPA: thioredoxin domain-containing protein [Dokdonella sp.]